MILFLIILLSIALIGVLSYLYVISIDDMNEQHPDYQANEFP